MAQKWHAKASVQTAIISGIVLVVVTGLVQWSPKSELESKVAKLELENSQLHVQLAPFVTLAAERFGGSDQLSLAKLSSQFRDLDEKLRYEEGVIRSMEVEVFARVSGSWVDSKLPDFSKYIRTGSRTSDLRILTSSKSHPLQWVEFEDSTPPRITAGEGEIRVIDYRARVPSGCWILGTHRSELLEIQTLEAALYGVNKDSTDDHSVKVEGITLIIHTNGRPTHTCEFTKAFDARLSEINGPVAKVQLTGPYPIKATR
jgi:hypothetical protein